MLQIRLFHRNALNIFMIAALSLNVLAAGLPALVANYNDQQQRIPQALASNVKTSSAPATDAAFPDGKITPLSDQLNAQ